METRERHTPAELAASRRERFEDFANARRLARLKRELRQSDQALVSLEDSLSVHIERVAALEISRDAFAKALEKARRDLDEARVAREQDAKSLEAYKRDVHNYRLKTVSLQAELDKTKLEIKRLQNTDELGKIILAKDSEISRLQYELSTNERQVETLIANRTALNQRIIDLQRDIDSRGMMVPLQTHRDEVERQRVRFETRLAELEGERLTWEERAVAGGWSDMAPPDQDKAYEDLKSANPGLSEEQLRTMLASMKPLELD